MSDILCVTGRALCGGDFLRQVERISAAGPAGILLREKDLAPEDYARLAEDVLAICREYGVPCILHSHPRIALALGCGALHMPLPLLKRTDPELRRRFAVLGASCHSVSDALRARELGCTYITAGHIFDTRCKPGMPPRGLDFLRDVCRSVDIPVYAIGGISPQNIAPVRAAGAAGACVMSAFMKTSDPGRLLREFAAEEA